MWTFNRGVSKQLLTYMSVGRGLQPFPFLINSCFGPTVPSKHIRWWRQASGNLLNFLWLMTNGLLPLPNSCMYVSSGYQTACRQHGSGGALTVEKYYGLLFSKVALHHQPLGSPSQSQWLCTCLTSESISCGGIFLLFSTAHPQPWQKWQYAMPESVEH